MTQIPATNSVPHEADFDPVPIFQAVGAAVDAWEYMEEHFAILYSIFVGRPYSAEGMQEYGLGAKSLATRMDRLKKAAESYFISAPNQVNEGTLADLKRRMDYLLIARHRIAHGRLRAVLTTPPQELALGDWMTPVPCYFWSVPEHATTTLKAKVFEGAGSKELLRLRELFLTLAKDLQEFCHRLEPVP